MQNAFRSPAKLCLVTVPVILGIGFLMGQLSNSGYANSWFDRLAKPAAMPPGWAFGAAWSLLYVLLGIALALILSAPHSRSRTLGLVLFLVQLALNFAWSPLFFAAHQIGLALAAIVAILTLSIVAALTLRCVRTTVPLLMLPYIGWLCFATYLNFEILRLNSGI